MDTGANVLLEVITKATTFAHQTASGWYKASEAMKLFPLKLIILERQRNTWTTLLKKYGMSTDPSIVPMLEEAIRLLDEEELKLTQLQSKCCLRLGKKLLFPDLVTSTLDNIIAAFEKLLQGMLQEDALRQQLEKATLNQVMPLLFRQDPKFVPFEARIIDVRKALENENASSIVIISGGPGQGKTSMAKYLACLYQDGVAPIHQTQSDQGKITCNKIYPHKLFVDGVFFLRCGDKANSKGLLRQLWQNFGYQALPDSTMDTNDEASSSSQMQLPLQSEEAILRQLSTRLQNQKVLIILDDVWESTMVDKLVVQQEGVKYLITTQTSRLRNDAVQIPISSPTIEEANQIIANHVEGFPKQVAPDLQGEINAIIEKSDRNPLMLANVAIKIRIGKASELEEWQFVKEYLEDLQDGDDKRPVCSYSRTYSKSTMSRSMQLALNSFSYEETTLLSIAAICESQPIPEVVFKIFFESIHLGLANFFTSFEHLETSQFIQTESKVVPWSATPQRSWSIHTMRQKYVNLIKEKEIELLFVKLREQVKHDHIVDTLLVLYGQVAWRNQAARRLGIPISKFENGKSNNGCSPLSPMKSLVWLLHVGIGKEWEKRAHILTKQVLHHYLIFEDIHEENISQLLSIKDTNLPIFHALCEISAMKDIPLLKAIMSFPLVPQTLVELLGDKMSPAKQAYAALSLGDISKYMPGNATKVASFPYVVERLVRLLAEGVDPLTQKDATWALGNICQNVAENAIQIGSFPCAVERLIGLLAKEVNPLTQANAAWALGTICEGVVENAIKIGSFPYAMERLVGLLAKGVNCNVQTNAAYALWMILWWEVENEVVLIRGIPNECKALEDSLICVVSEMYGESSLQYWGGKLYDLIYVDNGEGMQCFQSWKAYEGLGDAKVSRANYKGALQAYECGLAIEQKHGSLLCSRCFVKTMLEDFQGALTDANQYIEIGNNKSFGLQERGILRRLMGDLDGALVDLNEGLELDTEDYEMLKHRGLVKFLLKDEDGAKADAEWALKVKPLRVDRCHYGRGPNLGTSSVEFLSYKLK